MKSMYFWLIDRLPWNYKWRVQRAFLRMLKKQFPVYSGLHTYLDKEGMFDNFVRSKSIPLFDKEDEANKGIK